MAKALISSLVMAAFLWWMGGDIGVWAAADHGDRVVRLIGAVAGGGLLYFSALWICGVRPGDFHGKSPAAAA